MLQKTKAFRNWSAANEMEEGMEGKGLSIVLIGGAGRGQNCVYYGSGAYGCLEVVDNETSLLRVIRRR